MRRAGFLLAVVGLVTVMTPQSNAAGAQSAITVSIFDYSVAEGPGLRTLRIPVVPSVIFPPDDITITVALEFGTASDDDVASLPTPQTVTWGPAGMTGCICVDLIDDELLEPNETILAQIVDVEGGTVDRGEAVGTIRDDEPSAPAPAVAVSERGQSYVTATWSTVEPVRGILTGWSVVAVEAGGLAAWQIVAADVRSVSLPGLQVGHAYDISVIAATTEGQGQPSAPMSSSPLAEGPPARFPSAATIQAVGQGPDRVFVSWTPPEHDGGDPIIAYSAVAQRVSDLAVVGWVNVASDVRGTSIPNLTDAEYAIHVVSWNRVGPTDALVQGISLAPGPPAIPPAAVPWVTPYPTPGAITVSWGPPVSDGGAPITAYSIVLGHRAVDGGQPTIVDWHAVGPNDRWTSFSPRDPHCGYDVWVVASNALGFGQAVGPQRVVAPAPPGPPAPCLPISG